MHGRTIVLLTCVFIFFISAGAYGEDISSKYDLPPMKRAARGSLADSILKKARVLKYADEMPVKYTEVWNSDQYIRGLRLSIESRAGHEGRNYKRVYFNGKSSKELNAFLDRSSSVEGIEVMVREREIFLDGPIRMKSYTIINGTGVRFVAKKTAIAFIGKDISNAGLKNVTIDGPLECGIMLINAANCFFESIDVLGSRDKGMIIRAHSSFIVISQSRFRENLRGGIFLQDGSHDVLIRDCAVYGVRNSSNWAAGIVITSVPPVTEQGIRDAFDDKYYYYPKDLTFKKNTVPFRTMVEACHIHDNQASGIYVDGGNGNVFIGNYIAQNDKEGMCLDGYSTGNIVESNIFIANGFRKMQSDQDLKIDAVLQFGRLPDKSSAAKLPNISLDNTAYNLIMRNSISGAAGDGIKIVRSGFRNIFGLNTITDNNAGENKVFFFSGILLGSAAFAENYIDALPCVENIIFGNSIYGKHRHGIVIDGHGVFNDVYDNVVMKQKDLAVAAHDQPNSIMGNNFNETLPQPKRPSGVKTRKKLLFVIAATALYVVYRKYAKRKRLQL